MNERDDSWLDGKYGPEGCGSSFSSSFTWSCDDSMIAFVRGASIRIMDAQTQLVIKDLDFFVGGAAQTSKPLCPLFQKDTDTLVFAHGRTLYFMSTATWELKKSHKIVMESEEDTVREVDRAAEMNSITAQKGNCEKLTRDQIRIQVLEEYEFRHGMDHLQWLDEPNRLFLSCFQGWAVFDTENYKIVSSNLFGLTKDKSISLSPDGKFVAKMERFSISLSPVNSEEILLQENNVRISPKRGYWSPNSEKFIYTTGDRRIFAIDVTTKEVSVVGSYRDIYTPHIAWRPHSKYFAIHSPEDGLQIIDSNTGNMLCTYRDTANTEFQSILQGGFDWSWDGKRIVLGRRDDNIDVWTVPVI
jgi:hypothetical protein